MDLFEEHSLRENLLSGGIELEQERKGVPYTFTALTKAVTQLRMYVNASSKRARGSIEGVNWEITRAMSRLKGKALYWHGDLSPKRVKELHDDLTLEVECIEQVITKKKSTPEERDRIIKFIVKLAHEFLDKAKTDGEKRRPRDRYKKQTT